MYIDKKKLTTLTIITLAATLTGASAMSDRCAPEPPAPCYPDDSVCTYCLGPEMVNPPARPYTCDGDFVLSLSGLLWSKSQDGMEYAILSDTQGSDALTANPNLNQLFNAEYQRPGTEWDFGFKLGIAYNTTHDGWDFGVRWTWLNNSANDLVQSEPSDGNALLPLWSAFQFPNAGNAPILFAGEIKTKWKLELNLIDIELGREMWMSKYLSMRPFIGLEVAYLDQDYDIENRGGSYTAPGLQLNFNDWVFLRNDFKGIGLRSGFNSTWFVKGGFGFYGNFAASLIYGRFSVRHKEKLVRAISPFVKRPVLKAKDHFRAVRSHLEYTLGAQWATLFSNCRYGFSLMLGWEQHLFFNQNQLWRVTRKGGTNGSGVPNDSGENVHHQRRGDLSTQGVTLTAKLSF